MKSPWEVIEQLERLHDLVDTKLYKYSLDILRTGQEANKFQLREVSAEIKSRICGIKEMIENN